ncbi:MAG: type II toxin-antitoxin system RelE/ParE family toxin [Rhodospirillaceae bacterium]|nr:type II toxin-antitoxin system RelE/ParE family toxin [Rhodospirillaceae bacterium]
MFELKQTENFRKWWSRLRDERAKALIASRLNRLAYGHVGDVAPVGSGINELRIHHGPGYRVYFRRRANTLIVLLKGSQAKDIKLAKRIAEEWSE